MSINFNMVKARPQCARMCSNSHTNHRWASLPLPLFPEESALNRILVPFMAILEGQGLFRPPPSVFFYVNFCVCRPNQTLFFIWLFTSSLIFSYLPIWTSMICQYAYVCGVIILFMYMNYHKASMTPFIVHIVA
jgi:hypothetical protein